MARAAAEWVRKAEADHTAAVTLIRGNARLHDAVCFHCQQSAEKYLKALLYVQRLRIPRTHNLIGLLTLVAPHHPALVTLRRGMHILTRYAVETRYPGESATKRQAISAVKWAIRVRAACRQELGLRDRRTP